jgi:hypothetical protein
MQKDRSTPIVFFEDYLIGMNQLCTFKWNTDRLYLEAKKEDDDPARACPAV